MAELSQPMRLMRVHPLDAPVVAVAVHLRGADPERAEVVSAEAVRFHGGRVTGRFTTTPGDGGGSRLADLEEFIGDSPVAGYDLPSLAPALACNGVSLGLAAWDVRELAGLLMPREPIQSLPQLACLLSVEQDAATQGGASGAGEADTVRRVYQALVALARAQPGGLLRRMAGLLARSQSPLAELLAALADTAEAAGPIGGMDPREVAARLERPRPIGSPVPPEPLDPDEITRLLSGNGPFARRFPRYEPRLEQIAMARAVAGAFGPGGQGGAPHHLIVEGGTGIGKSVAYLLPAVLFAARNNVRVVVSTNTINLQEQLLRKDIPDLLAVLAEVPDLDLSRFRYTQMKGKANYLCLRRWEAQANSDTVAPDDARLLARTLTWLRETRTGDRSELDLRGREAAAWERLSAAGFGLCPGAREGACFYRHARDEANAAHLMVVNHALLLADLQVEGTVLPPYDYLVIDEAHNLEEEATRQFGFRVTQSTMEEIVERLGSAIHELSTALRIGAGARAVPPGVGAHGMRPRRPGESRDPEALEGRDPSTSSGRTDMGQGGAVKGERPLDSGFRRNDELAGRVGSSVRRDDERGDAHRVPPPDAARREALQQRMEDAQLPLYRVRDTWAQLAAGLTGFAAPQPQSGAGAQGVRPRRPSESRDPEGLEGRTGDPSTSSGRADMGQRGAGDLRITPALRAQPAWSELEIAWDSFERAAADATNRAEALWRDLEGLSADAVPGLEDIRGTLAEWLADQAEVRSHVAGFVARPDDSMVYWLGRGSGPLSLNGAPLEVGPRLQEELFAQKQCVILTSATLTVRGSFQHVRQRLGVEDAAEAWLGSPFDYRKAALLCLPTDVPDPTSPRYADAVAAIVGRLAEQAGGRTMALFTSHAAVRATAAALRRLLPDRDIGVLAQGVDGTPQQLLARFQQDPRAALLGTASFWEGVDITDNALKVLVVARLPFNVPTEPVFAARAELYDAPFMDYAVPQAVLRFRQGFGRLVRNKDDHGAVVVLDSRMTSKSYGKTFLGSLPAPTTLRAPLAQVFPAVQDWLATAMAPSSQGK